MRCHYEVLGVEREASATEIKTAYRRMALQWHPDKNIDDEQRAKEQFQLVQTAYEVLSDLHERAWYDKHREQLLRGAGSEFTDDSLDVFPFMSPSCYRGFTDDEKGFYAVYREVFSKLATEETDFLENPEDVSKIPDFGDSSSPYEVVNEFYNYWMSFTTSKTYVWLDQHDIRQSQHRKLVKVIERENAKVRTTARKERNTAVRTLASYARRRDPRVKRHLDELKTRAQQNRAKMEAARTERLAAHRTSLLAEAQAERSRRADEDVDYAKKLREVERQLQDEFGVSSDDQITTGDESGDDESDETAPPNADDQNSPAQSLNRDQRLYCSACRKPFNTVPAFQNHEKSKKHRENVGKMTLNDSLPMSSEDTSLPSEATESAKKKKKKKKGKKKTETSSLLDVTSDLDQSNDDRSFAELQGGRKARKLDRKIRLIGARPGDRGSETENNERTTTESNVTQSDEQTNDVSVSKESVECESNGLPASEAAESPQDQPAKVKKAPPKKVQAELSCAVCKGQFSSKNKLFEHLKKSGHQVPIGTADIKIKRRAKR